MNSEKSEFSEISVDEGLTPAASGERLTSPPIKTADGEFYDSGEIYFYFESQSARVRESGGLRLIGEHLCRFGSKVVAVRYLHADRDGALDDGQKHFRREIKRLEKQINQLETKKTGARRKLKNFALIRGSYGVEK